MSKRYSHAVSLNFSLRSKNEEPTPGEILDRLKEKVAELDELTVYDHIEIFDSEDTQGD